MKCRNIARKELVQVGLQGGFFIASGHSFMHFRPLKQERIHFGSLNPENSPKYSLYEIIMNRVFVAVRILFSSYIFIVQHSDPYRKIGCIIVHI